MKVRDHLEVVREDSSCYKVLGYFIVIYKMNALRKILSRSWLLPCWEYLDWFCGIVDPVGESFLLGHFPRKKQTTHTINWDQPNSQHSEKLRVNYADAKFKPYFL